jgi:hypothetical protein
MSYILNLNGDVVKDGKIVEGKKIVQNMSPDSVSSYLGIRRKEMTFGIFDDENETASKSENTLIMDEAGNVEKYDYFRNFNTVFDEEENNSIFATELEIANGSSPFTALSAMLPGDAGALTGTNDLLKKLSISLDIMLQAIAHILISEAILTLNSIIQSDDSNEVEEKYHLKLGEYYLTDYDAISTYIFKTLNYPKEKSGIISIDERIAAYLIGLSEFVNSDKLIDWGKISRLDKDNILGRKEREKYSFIPGSSNFDMSNVLWATIIYVFETVASLSTTGMNRLYMLARKFENEKLWNSDDQLYRHKIKSPDRILSTGKEYYADSFDKKLADMNYYYFKFVIERMHIGLKIIRRFQYNMMRDIKENGRNRVGLSKSGIKSTASDSSIRIVKDTKQEYWWADEDSGSENSQSTRLRSLPQSFIMPHSFIKSMIINRQIGDPNEFKISLGGDNSIAQNFAITKNKRLSAELVKKLENHLDKEYMPFYLHDTRTNEIISFHAFIEAISDGFTQSTNPQSGFGRMDDVHHFVKATRSVRVSFVVVATSKEDYDLMWYQINKLVAMCYPQWSKGYKLDPNNDSSTEYPFSQVPTASPLVRMRLGDVIKSNYTKQNVSRLYGAENALHDYTISKLTEMQLRYSTDERKKSGGIKSYLIPGIYKFTPPGSSHFSPTSSDRYINLKDYTEATISKQKENYVEVEVENPETKKKIKIVADAYSIVEKNIVALKDDKASKLNEAIVSAKKVFFNTENEGVINPIIAGYESALGKGLAGFITNLSLDYFSNATWEIADKSKAPKTVKIDISFAPIHDIPLGLDSDGMLRAPAYNVGEINNSLFGSVYKDHNEIKKNPPQDEE